MRKSKGPLSRTSSADDGEINEPAPTTTSTTFPIVGVGASAGGVEAFIELLRHIPEGAGLAFVLIQHLDPTHPSYLSEALARSTSLPVHEIQDGMQVAAGPRLRHPVQRRRRNPQRNVGALAPARRGAQAASAHRLLLQSPGR